MPRPNLRGLESDDWDERVADLQYRDVCEYAVGHGVATHAVLDDEGALPRGPHLLDSRRRGRAGRPGARSRASSCAMEALAELADGAAAQAKPWRRS